MWSRIHLIPLLQAEEDRDLVRRYYADKAREKALMGSETKVYHSGRYVSFDRRILQHVPLDTCVLRVALTPVHLFRSPRRFVLEHWYADTNNTQIRPSYFRHYSPTHYQINHCECFKYRSGFGLAQNLYSSIPESIDFHSQFTSRASMYINQ